MYKVTSTLLVLITLLNTSCVSMKRHPVIYGVVIGAAVGTTVALATRHTCPNKINGVPYAGTPPCPEYWPPDNKSK